MSTTRRKGEKSATTAASDREHAVRKEYHNAGALQGMVDAWGLVRKLREHYAAVLAKVEGDPSELRAARGAARVAELMLAREVRRRWPKSGEAALVAGGWKPAGSGDTDAAR